MFKFNCTPLARMIAWMQARATKPDLWAEKPRGADPIRTSNFLVQLPKVLTCTGAVSIQ